MFKPHTIIMKCSNEKCNGTHEFIIPPGAFSSIALDIKHWRSMALCDSCKKWAMRRNADKFRRFMETEKIDFDL